MSATIDKGGDPARHPRGVRGSPKKDSKKKLQGAALPRDGSTLGSYPVGCCVLLNVDGALAWFLIAFRIGGNQHPHMRRLVHPPNSLSWNAGPSAVREFRGDLVVVASAWPRRATDERALDAQSDPDPLLAGIRLDESAEALGDVSGDAGDPLSGTPP